jgi:hypothetical protein
MRHYRRRRTGEQDERTVARRRGFEGDLQVPQLRVATDERRLSARQIIADPLPDRLTRPTWSCIRRHALCRAL